MDARKAVLKPDMVGDISILLPRHQFFWTRELAIMMLVLFSLNCGEVRVMGMTEFLYLLFLGVLLRCFFSLHLFFVFFGRLT